jgi:hypothetical protein
MNITRQYSLPNCTLVLEGLSETDEENPTTEVGKAPMSILVNAECHFFGTNQLISGGRVFLENLVRTASAYTQELLSGLPHPQNTGKDLPLVHLEKISQKNLHRLTLEPEADSNQEKIEIELTTVQLFDLVEAIDQFLADSKTLPDLTLDLQPLSKRYRQQDEPLADKVIPAALGITSLAIAAVALYLIPPPVIQEPEPKLESNPNQTIPLNPPSQPPGASPNPNNNSQEGNSP